MPKSNILRPEYSHQCKKLVVLKYLIFSIYFQTITKTWTESYFFTFYAGNKCRNYINFTNFFKSALELNILNK